MRTIPRARRAIVRRRSELGLVDDDEDAIGVGGRTGARAFAAHRRDRYSLARLPLDRALGLPEDDYYGCAPRGDGYT